jgi:RND family efflux transporter MFP subunit
MSDQPDDLGFELPAAAKQSRTGILIVLAVIVGGGFAFGWIQHRKAHGDTALPRDNGPVHVQVIKPATLSSDRALVLPGVAKPLEETKIFPRTTGYVKRWLVDIGDSVKEGQLLAEIETPDLDAQLSQARAQLASARAAVKQAIAQRDFAKQNSARYETLADQKLVSKSQVEQAQAQSATDEATVAAAEANVNAQEANVRRLTELQGFSKVTAPFAGKITTRTIDRGSLLSDNGTTPMFVLVASDPIRIFVDIPQNVAPSVKVGTDVAVTVRGFADRTFPGKVTRSAGALDPELHTMSTEIQVPNTDGALLPGMYVQAALTLPVPHKVLEIPSTSLYSDASGLRVAVVDAHNKIHFAPITIEADTGSTLRIATGLTGDERILKIAVPTLLDGDAVEVDPTPPPPAQGAGSKAPKP